MTKKQRELLDEAIRILSIDDWKPFTRAKEAVKLLRKIKTQSKPGREKE